MSDLLVNVCPARDMAVADLYDILRLRSDVFDLEQRCTANDLDGRDLEPGTVHYWIVRSQRTIGCLRVLEGSGGDRWIGRVCVERSERRAGLASKLMARAVDRHGGHRLLLHGQAHLAGWYSSFGFTIMGEAFEQAGIPHVEMIRPPGGPSADGSAGVHPLAPGVPY